MDNNSVRARKDDRDEERTTKSERQVQNINSQEGDEESGARKTRMTVFINTDRRRLEQMEGGRVGGEDVRGVEDARRVRVKLKERVTRGVSGDARCSEGDGSRGNR